MRRIAVIALTFVCLAPVSVKADTSKPVLSGLRGARVTTVRCDLITVNGDDRPVTGTIRSFRVCPQPAIDGATGAAIVLSPTKRSVAFRAMRSALAASDGVAKPGEVCPMYADVFRQVFVVTSKGIWSMHLPVDSCRHYTRAVQGALGAAA